MGACHVQSGTEFSTIQKVFGDHRLNAEPHVENRNVDLILADYKSEACLDDLANRSVAIWQECFQKHSRTTTRVRNDPGRPHDVHNKLVGNSARAFLRKIHEDVSSKATPGASSSLTDRPVLGAAVWTARHQSESVFQMNKRHKRVISASFGAQLLPEERTADLEADAVVEGKRQEKSYADRVRHREKYDTPPEECMTITKTRAVGKGYWCSTKGAPLEPDYLVQLQGFSQHEVPWREAKLKPSAISGLLGNGQTCTLVRALLPHVLFHAKWRG